MAETTILIPQNNDDSTNLGGALPELVGSESFGPIYTSSPATSMTNRPGATGAEEEHSNLENIGQGGGGGVPQKVENDCSPERNVSSALDRTPAGRLGGGGGGAGDDASPPDHPRSSFVATSGSDGSIHNKMMSSAVKGSASSSIGGTQPPPPTVLQVANPNIIPSSPPRSATGAPSGAGVVPVDETSELQRAMPKPPAAAVPIVQVDSAASMPGVQNSDSSILGREISKTIQASGVHGEGREHGTHISNSVNGGLLGNSTPNIPFSAVSPEPTLRKKPEETSDDDDESGRAVRKKRKEKKEKSKKSKKEKREKREKKSSKSKRGRHDAGNTPLTPQGDDIDPQHQPAATTNILPPPNTAATNQHNLIPATSSQASITDFSETALTDGISSSSDSDEDWRHQQSFSAMTANGIGVGRNRMSQEALVAKDGDGRGQGVELEPLYSETKTREDGTRIRESTTSFEGVAAGAARSNETSGRSLSNPPSVQRRRSAGDTIEDAAAATSSSSHHHQFVQPPGLVQLPDEILVSRHALPPASEAERADDEANEQFAAAMMGGSGNAGYDPNHDRVPPGLYDCVGSAFAGSNIGGGGGDGTNILPTPGHTTTTTTAGGDSRGNSPTNSASQRSGGGAGCSCWRPGLPLKLAYVTWNMALNPVDPNGCFITNFAHVIALTTQENGPYVGTNALQNKWAAVVENHWLRQQYTVVGVVNQMALHLIVLARTRDVLPFVCNLHCDKVSTGAGGGAFANKGGVAVSLTLSPFPLNEDFAAGGGGGVGGIPLEDRYCSIFLKGKNGPFIRALQSQAGKPITRKRQVSILLVGSHLTAHQHNISRRNDDYKKIVTTLKVGKAGPFPECIRDPVFIRRRGTSPTNQNQQLLVPSASRQPNAEDEEEPNESSPLTKDNTVSAHAQDADQAGSPKPPAPVTREDEAIRDENSAAARRGAWENTNSNSAGSPTTGGGPAPPSPYDRLEEQRGGQLLELEGDNTVDFDVCIFGGDLNYRINGTKDSIQYVINNIHDLQPVLVANDQLMIEQKKGVVFHNFVEGPLGFLPTYKFGFDKKAKRRKETYDDNKKKARMPAYCDRVLIRKSLHYQYETKLEEYVSSSIPMTSDHLPVTAIYSIQTPPPLSRRDFEKIRRQQRSSSEEEAGAEGHDGDPQPGHTSQTMMMGEYSDPEDDFGDDDDTTVAGAADSASATRREGSNNNGSPAANRSYQGKGLKPVHNLGCCC